MVCCSQAERELQSKQQLVQELGTKNEQLTKKLEATHSELTQKVLNAMKDAEQVWPLPLSDVALCIALALQFSSCVLDKGYNHEVSVEGTD